MSTTASRSLNIIIVGGGISGLAAAAWLREEHNVTVLEKYPLDFGANITNDYGMSLVSNAYKLLSSQGSKEENLQAVIFTHLWDRSKDNEVLREMEFDTRKRFGAPSIFARRSRVQAELHRFATDPSRPGKPAKIITNVKIKSLDPIAGIVVTDSGAEMHGDLIIGADGINSSIRAAVLARSKTSISEGTPDVPTGFVGYVTNVPADVIASDPDLQFQAVHGVAGICVWTGSPDSQRKVLCYPCDNKTYFQVFAYAPETPWVEEFEKNRSTIVNDVPKERLLQEFQDFHPCVQKILGQSPTVTVRRIRDIEPLDVWTVGKTVLIGDAAHAVTPHVGQGCNIAIEDAEALGFLFKGVTVPTTSSTESQISEITEKLEIFQALRVKRAHLVQLTSRQRGGLLKGEEKEKAAKFDGAAFGRLIYGYSGFEPVYKAFLAEQEGRNESLVSM